MEFILSTLSGPIAWTSHCVHPPIIPWPAMTVPMRGPSTPCGYWFSLLLSTAGHSNHWLCWVTHRPLLSHLSGALIAARHPFIRRWVHPSLAWQPLSLRGRLQPPSPPSLVPCTPQNFFSTLQGQDECCLMKPFLRPTSFLQSVPLFYLP